MGTAVTKAGDFPARGGDHRSPRQARVDLPSHMIPGADAAESAITPFAGTDR